MTKMIGILWLLTALTTIAQTEDLVIKFDTAESWQGKGVQLSTVREGLKITIPAAPAWKSPAVVYPLTESNFAKTIGDTQNINLDVDLVDGGGATVSFTVKDAGGENFSLKQQAVKPGANHLIWNLEQDRAPKGWGGTPNGKLDYPLSMVSMNLHQYPAEKPAVLLFRNPAIKIEHGTALVQSDIVYFDQRGQWQGDNRLKLTPQADGLAVKHLKAPVTGEKTILGGMKEITFDLKDIGSPEKIICDVSVIAGGGVTLGMVVADRNGENFSLKQKPLQARANQVVWLLPADIAGSWGDNKDGKLDMPLKVIRLEVFQYPSDQPGELLFQSLQKREIKRDVDAVSFEYQTSAAVPIVKLGEEDKFRILVGNEADKDLSFNVKLTFRHYSGSERIFERNFALKGKEVAAWDLQWKPEKLGVWRAERTVTSLDQTRVSRDRRTSFAYLEPAGPNEIKNNEFILGYNMRQHRWAPRDREVEAEAAAVSGGKLLRTGYTWEGIEREDNVFDFGPADALIKLNERYHMQQMFLIGYTPSFAAKPDLLNSKDWNDWNKSAPDKTKLERFVRKLGEHYRGTITFYEFWNEPDLDFWRGSYDEYLERLKIVYQTLKAADPDAKLISGGIAGEHAAAKPGFHEALVRDGQDYFDYHGYHKHGDYQSYRQVLDGVVRQYRQALKTPKPMFFTETGFYVANNNYLQQAENVVKKIVYARAYGARGYIWYDLRDDGLIPGYHEHNYGLLTFDWYPKEGFAVYNTVSLLLGDAYFVKTLQSNAQSDIYEFKRGNDRVLCFWRTENQGIGEAVKLNVDAARAELIDWMGNRQPLAVTGQKVNFTVPEHPGFAVFYNVKGELSLAERTITLADSKVVAAPGRPAKLVFEIDNLERQPQTLAIDWRQKPETVEIDNFSTRVQPGKQRVEIPFTLKSDNGDPVRLEMIYLLGKESGQLSIPVNPAKPVGQAYPDQPQFSLTDRKSVVSMMEHNPYTEHRVWTGPADQSAKIYLAATDSELKVRIEVTDDKLFKSKSAEKCYMEDGVQLALAFPGQNGHWEFGLCVLENGAGGSCCWIAPSGMATPEIMVNAQVTAQGVNYEATLHLTKLGITPQVFAKGIRFNVLINENDGEGRDGWLQISPGIGESKNPDLYTNIVLAR